MAKRNPGAQASGFFSTEGKQKSFLSAHKPYSHKMEYANGNEVRKFFAALFSNKAALAEPRISACLPTSHDV